ncbi:MAG: Gfo/Idh/MocA family protein [Burkholderiales bacterium]
MADVIRVGVVGASVTEGRSGWGSGAHVPALKALPGYQLKAVCTSQESTANASAEKFGAELGFHRFDDMLAHDDIDLISVVVRVPGHHELVMKALNAGKAVFCEWPLGNGLKEGLAMAELARKKGVANMVGLQSRSDPTIRYARELVEQGYLGEVLFANLKVIPASRPERGNGRIWQGLRKNGANPLTIPGGHSMDAVLFILGSFTEVSARVATRVTTWHNTDTGEDMQVDAPDAVSAIGKLKNNAEVNIQIATAPISAPGIRLEIYGDKGTLAINTVSINLGPNKIFGAQGDGKLAELAVPERFSTAPANTPAGPPRNVAHAYARFAKVFRAKERIDPDFETALGIHRLIDAIERSAAERRTIDL